MRRDQKRGPLYTPGFNMRDIEFFDEAPAPRRKQATPAPVKKVEQPATKKVAPNVVKRRSEADRLIAEKKTRNRRRKIQRFRAKRRCKQQEKKFAKHFKELARLVAFDLLEIRAESFQENEIKFREQQQREAKAYTAKLTAAFREAVKEAAEKAAA